MGFLDKIFSGTRKALYRHTCRVMIDSYTVLKRKFPEMPPIARYVQALMLRPKWEWTGPNTFKQKGKYAELKIDERDEFQDVVRNVIIYETMSSTARSNDELQEIIEVLREEFKNFKE